jgi:hypothetical protein
MWSQVRDSVVVQRLTPLCTNSVLCINGISVLEEEDLLTSGKPPRASIDKGAHARGSIMVSSQSDEVEVRSPSGQRNSCQPRRDTDRSGYSRCVVVCALKKPSR